MAGGRAQLTVSDIARRVGLGLARQSVQRTADLLVDKGWARYLDNPRHVGARVLEPSEKGRETLTLLRDAQHAWADAVDAAVGAEELREFLATAQRIMVASREYRGELSWFQAIQCAASSRVLGAG